MIIYFLLWALKIYKTFIFWTKLLFLPVTPRNIFFCFIVLTVFHRTQPPSCSRATGEGRGFEEARHHAARRHSRGRGRAPVARLLSLWCMLRPASAFCSPWTAQRLTLTPSRDHRTTPRGHLSGGILEMRHPPTPAVAATLPYLNSVQVKKLRLGSHLRLTILHRRLKYRASETE